MANRGNITPEDAPDANGNYWNNIHSTSGNNITAGSAFSTVKNADGTAVTGMNVTVNGQFNTNGLSGGGGLLAPDAALLGDLAVATATQDYMFLDGNNVDNRAFTISGLDPDHAYTFGIFTSRKANDTRTGRFTVEGYNTFTGENQAAGSGIGAAGENQNTSVILATEPVFPTPEGTIKITVSRVTRQYIPLNCMKMTELSGYRARWLTSLTAVSSLISAPRRREPTSARPRRRPTSTATGGTTSPIRQTAANMPPKAP